MFRYLSNFRRDTTGSKELVVMLMLLALVAIPLVLFLRSAADDTQKVSHEQVKSVLELDTKY